MEKSLFSPVLPVRLWKEERLRECRSLHGDQAPCVERASTHPSSRRLSRLDAQSRGSILINSLARSTPQQRMVRAAAPRWAECVLVLSFAAHVLVVAPTKVEESFPLTAVRDVVVHGPWAPQRVRHNQST